MAGDAATAAQDVAGDGQFVGRGADVGAGVVQDEVLEMHELAVEPQRGAGVGKILALKQASADRRAGNPFIDPGQGGRRLGDMLQQTLDGQMSEIVTH